MSNATWQDLYDAALVELDPEKLPERVEAVRQAIHQYRMQKGHTLRAEERDEIDDANAVYIDSGEGRISPLSFAIYASRRLHASGQRDSQNSPLIRREHHQLTSTTSQPIIPHLRPE